MSEDLLGKLRDRASTNLPAHLGVEITSAGTEAVEGRLAARPEVIAPNGFMHAASVIGLLDTLCGFATIANLPEGAVSFTTIELKSNFLGTVRDGALLGRATPVHRGRTTQVWDAVGTDEKTGKTVAMFRCTQMILWPRK